MPLSHHCTGVTYVVYNMGFKWVCLMTHKYNLKAAPVAVKNILKHNGPDESGRPLESFLVVFTGNIIIIKQTHYGSTVAS